MLPSFRPRTKTVQMPRLPVDSGVAKRAGRRYLHRFARDEDGTLVVFSLFIFLAMLMFGGLAVDMIRYENERIRMQSAADRAVLAATMLRDNEGSATPEQILQAYFAAEGLSDQLGDHYRIEEDNENGRVITVYPAATVPSLFMQLLGIDSFAMTTPAQAAETIDGGPDVELVMVLDVSGSMNGQQKLGAMQTAAVNLTSTLLNDADEIGDVGITLVPYDTYVLPPPGFLNFFSNAAGNGACNDWLLWTQITSSLNLLTNRRNCNTATWRTVRPYVSDATLAETYINDLRAAGTTSIDLGIRYGALFFDPTIRPAISQLIANGDIDPAFEGRPYDWTEPNVVRALILLTDGTNCCGERFGTLIQDANTLAVCQALKDQGVLIYAIAYQAPTASAALMQGCASSANHFYNTSADEIISVFEGITASIQTQALRLTL
ncbi:pilus assembly protein TadG-related protein [Cereibacter sphaeroides]|nr:pilus assembly protein TadG-related protein [Cereibacter sphaeroides]